MRKQIKKAFHSAALFVQNIIITRKQQCMFHENIVPRFIKPALPPQAPKGVFWNKKKTKIKLFRILGDFLLT